MPQMTRTVEERLEGTSAIEDVENCSINNIFISSLTRQVADIKTDEEIKICENEFSDLLIDFSEDVNPREDMSIMDGTSSTVFNPPSEMSQLDTESKFLNEDNCSDDSSMPLKKFECFGVCDPDTVQKIIEVIDCDYRLGGTVLKKTNSAKKENCMTGEKSTQTIEETVQNGIEVSNQSANYSTNEIASSTLLSSYFLNGPNMTKVVNKLNQVKIPDYEKSDETFEEYVAEVVKGKSWTLGSFHNQSIQPMDTCKPSQKIEVRGNARQSSEDGLDQTIKAMEDFNPIYVSCLTLSHVFEEISNQVSQSVDLTLQTSAIRNNLSSGSETSNSVMITSDSGIVSEILEYLSQLPPTGNTSSPASEISNRFMIMSKPGIEQPITSETLDYLSQTEVFRIFCNRRKLQKTQITEALNFLRNIISILDNIEFMNNCLTKTFEAFINLQHSIQELINVVYESLVEFQFLPSPYIFVDNEYTDGKVKFNVQLFGEDIFKNLKSMKKELNGLFRELLAFRKNFKHTSKKLFSVPFDKTLDHEIQSTLDKTIGIYNLICRVFKYSERLEFFKDKIGSETLSEVSRAKDFGDYLNILKENPSGERLV